MSQARNLANIVTATASTNSDGITFDGTLNLKEQADADADTAAYGQVWVNTATPNELYFTGDSGVDVQITNATGLAADTVQDDYGNVLGHSTAGDALDTADGGIPMRTHMLTSIVLIGGLALTGCQNNTETGALGGGRARSGSGPPGRAALLPRPRRSPR